MRHSGSVRPAPPPGEPHLPWCCGLDGRCVSPTTHPWVHDARARGLQSHRETAVMGHHRLPNRRPQITHGWTIQKQLGCVRDSRATHRGANGCRPRTVTTDTLPLFSFPPWNCCHHRVGSLQSHLRPSHQNNKKTSANVNNVLRTHSVMNVQNCPQSVASSGPVNTLAAP